MNRYILTPFVGYAVVLCHKIIEEYPCAEIVFTDRNEGLHGKRYNGVSITSVDQVREHFSDAKVIICSYQHAAAIQRLYFSKGFTNIKSDISDLFDKDTFLQTIKLVDFEQLSFVKPSIVNDIINIEAAWESYFLPEHARNTDALVINRVNICITTRCSLRCKDCASNSQYYEYPQDYSLDINKKTFEAFIQKVDFVRELTILGGEPLLYRESLADLIYSIASSKYAYKIGRLAMVTNGTLLPNEEVLKVLKECDVYVYISDYNTLSKKMNVIEKNFQENGIAYIRKSDLVWYSVCKIIDGDTVTEEEANEKLRNCEITCKEIRNGKFFYCTFLGATFDLKATPDDLRNYINLMDDRVTKKDLEEYIGRKTSFPGCKWCSGGDNTEKVDMLAVQAKKPLIFKKYS